MLAIILSILTALFESFKDLLSKKNLKKLDPYVVAFGMWFFTALFLFPLIFFISVPELTKYFWIAIVVNGSLNILATIFFMKAIKNLDISLCMPLVAFTPLFMLITSPLIVGEFPSLVGIIGIVLIVLGAYLLNLKERKKGLFYPLKALIKEKGSRYMLFVAFIWSISSNFDKVGINNSSPLVWIIVVSVYIMLGLFVVMLIKSDKPLIKLKEHSLKIIPIGFVYSIALITQMIAVSMTLVAYVISIKRTSAVLGVVWGKLFFKEEGFKERIIGAVIMVLGVVLIVFSP